MDSLISTLLFHQWQRKCMALITAVVIWLLVNQSITTTKTIPSVPIRVINLPSERTITGLLPNGFLSKRIPLTVSGKKEIVESLEPGDIEVLLDAANQPNEWIVQITKKNLVSLNPNIDLSRHITQVTHSEFVLKLSPLKTEKITVTIHPPVGEPPKGYQFLDIWPLHLTHTVSGPEEQILLLKNNGLDLTFDLSNITKEDLNALKNVKNGPYNDEISFFVPAQWKRVTIPFLNNISEEINDPDAKNLQIDFLRDELHPLKSDLPIRAFYPLKYSEKINPDTFALSVKTPFQVKNNITVLSLPLYSQHVSKLFLDIVRDNIEAEIVAAPKSERENLAWSFTFVDSHHLEDTYVAFLISSQQGKKTGQKYSKERERDLRDRFRNYMQKFMLYISQDHRLELESSLQDGAIKVEVQGVNPQITSSSTNS